MNTYTIALNRNLVTHLGQFIINKLDLVATEFCTSCAVFFFIDTLLKSLLFSKEKKPPEEEKKRLKPMNHQLKNLVCLYFIANLLFNLFPSIIFIGFVIFDRSGSYCAILTIKDKFLIGNICFIMRS